MALSREERRALRELERQLVEDPQIDGAFSTLPQRPGSQRFRIPMHVGWAVVAVGAVATIGLLAISFVLSFIGFLLMLVGATAVAPSVVDTVRVLVTGGAE